MFIGVCAVKWSEICNIFVMNCTAPNYCNVIKSYGVYDSVYFFIEV